ncbi:hypothetical protein PybrP1_006637 [[Pythium] brassicae (nom. inval.)]|nr:hypothetical protein PybrP1_006637 [[Pythium] brassicae (nom. inval.)]
MDERDGSVRATPPADEWRLAAALLEAPTDARLAALLRRVTAWPCDAQANLRHWGPVLARLQRLLEAASPRLVLVGTSERHQDKQEESGAASPGSDEETRELTGLVYEALRFSALLLQNAANKHVYTSVECVSEFLGARNEHVAFEATRVLAMLALPPQAHRLAADPTVGGGEATALARNGAVRRQLLTIAQGRGVVNSSLDVVDFLAPTSEPTALSREPTTFQFYRTHAEEETAADDDDDDGGSQMVTVPIPAPAAMPDCSDTGAPTDTERRDRDVLHAESAYAAATACDALVRRYNVPARLRFALYTKVRSVYATRSRASREAVVVERLLANLALFHAFSESWDVTSYVAQNPELTRALAELVRVDVYETVPVRVRVAALQVLTALVADHGGRSGGVGVLGRQSHVLTALGVAKGTPHGVFPALVRFCMSELESVGPAPSPASGASTAAEADSDMDMSLAVAFVHATTDLPAPHDAETAAAAAAAPAAVRTSGASAAVDAKLSWIEAVLGLLTAVVGIQLGASVLTENGIVPALLHVITVPSTSAHHAVVTTQCVQALETTLSNHNAAAALYRDLNGVGILIDRLHVECASVLAVPTTTTTMTLLPEPKVALVVALIVTLSVSFHSQGVMSAGATSRVIREGSVLSKVLAKIFRCVDAFGTEVVAQAAILVSDIINNDPSSVNHVHSGGLADAFLDTLTRWDVNALHPTNALLPPSAELVMAVPSVLNVLCLTSPHAEKVAKRAPLLHLLDMFALPAYATDDAADTFQAEAASVVGGGVFELMRHLPTFQSGAIQACVHAIKKVVRFGDEHAVAGAGAETAAPPRASEYLVFLRMAARVADLVEPILNKSEYAVAFADHGGVAALFRMYRLVLPTTTSFLSSALASPHESSSAGSDSRRMSHHAAAQATTLTLRAYASQQPTAMLTALVKELTSQLDGLKAARAVIGARWELSESDEGAEGVLCLMPDVELAELFGEPVGARSSDSSSNVGKISSVGEYLRVLSTVEWLTGLLVWTLRAAHSVQSRRWFTEFGAKATQQMLARLFAVDRSVQYERASLAELHKTHAPAAASRNETTGLWKVGSLLLLRFTVAMRGLLTTFGKSFLSLPLPPRRGDDAAAPLAAHATALAAIVRDAVEGHLLYILEAPRAEHMGAFVRQYYLTFLLETVVSVLFEGKAKQANTLLLLQLLKPLARDADAKFRRRGDALASDDVDMAPGGATCLLQVILDVAAQFFQQCLDRQPAASTATTTGGVLSRMDMTSFRIAAVALKRLSDLESISASPLTAALAANEYAGDAVELDRPFTPRVLTVQLHNLCLKVLLAVWRHPNFAALPAEECLAEILPIAVTVLKTRLDQAEAAAEAATSGDAEFDFLAGSRRHGLGFGRGRGPGGFDDDSMALRGALFGGGSTRRPGSRLAFVPDAAIVDNLAAMGFPRPRVERALRRIQINDVELAMEWILSHPDDDDALHDEEKAPDDNDPSAAATEAAAAADDAPSDSASAVDSDEKQRERNLFQSYAALRDEFEAGCFRILQTQAALHSVTVEPTASASSASVYPHENLVKVIAEDLAAVCGRSPEERETVLTRVNAAVLQFFGPDGRVVPDFDETYFTTTTHLLALMLQLQPDSRSVLQRQRPCCVEQLLEHVSWSATQALASSDGDVTVSCAPVMLILDAMASGASTPLVAETPRRDVVAATDAGGVDSEHATATTQEAGPKSLPARFQHRLVDVCVQLLTLFGKPEPRAVALMAPRRIELRATVAHAVFQLLARVTLDFEVASEFLARGGVDLVLHIRAECVFSGYAELVCTLLSHVLESPDVLQQLMEDKIERALTKLAARLGSPSQMRITPRALLMELAPVAARNEDVFAKALERAVLVKKSETGRTYVLPRKASTESAAAIGASSDRATAPVDDDTKEKKTSAVAKVAKSHKQAIQLVASKIVDKVRAVWADEKHAGSDAAQHEREKAARLAAPTRPGVCVGMYLEFLAHLVASFPADSFLRLVLKELLPSKELCRFVALRKSFKDRGLYGASAGVGADLPLAEVSAFLSVRAKERVQSAHRLLSAIVEQSADGAKCIVAELLYLLREWLRAAEGDALVRDDDALSAVHAWVGLIMSIAWPNGSTKGFAWDRIGASGSQQGKHVFVGLLADALRKVDLTHPLAHATCTMLLRPLATLTRSFVAERVRRAHKKRNAAPVTTTGDSAAAASSSSSPGAPDASTQTLAEDSAPSSQTVDVPSHTAVARRVDDAAAVATATVDVGTSTAPLSVDDDEDVTMRTPTSGVGDHDMRDAEDASDGGESDRSSESGHSVDEGDEEGEDDDDEEEEEEDDGDDDDDEEEDEEEDEDEDDEDEDDDDDEEHSDDLLRLRVLRGTGGAHSSRRPTSRLWGTLDSDLSVIDALDEVDEDEYSYLHILDDEAQFCEEQHRRAQQAAQRVRESGASASTGAGATVNTLLDAFMVYSDLGDSRSHASTRSGSAEHDEYPFDLPSSELFRGVALDARGHDRHRLGVLQNAMLQFIDDLPDVGEDDLLFESFEMGTNALRTRSRDRVTASRQGDVAVTTHPLLRPRGPAETVSDDSSGLRAPARLSLPRHSSLLRELQELSEHVQTQLPTSFGGGGRARAGLQRGGSGRYRPPSRNSRLSAVSNLLSEFSLDIPPSSHLPHSQTRSHRLGQRGSGRSDRDLFGGRGLRGDTGGASSATLWGPGAPGRDVDIRSVASRLEQRINQMYVEDAPRHDAGAVAASAAAPVRRNDDIVGGAVATALPPAPVEASGRAEPGASRADSEVDSDEQRAQESGDSHEQAAGNDVASETASVIALASTFGESTTIRSPEEPDGSSETEAAASPMLRDDELETRASGITLSDQSSSAPPLPPPAPVSAAPAMMSFTLDLSGLQAPSSSTTSGGATDAARSRSSDHDEETKNDDVSAQAVASQGDEDATVTESDGLQCPEGIDPEVFASLPPDMQAEIVAQSAPTPVSTSSTSAAHSGGGGGSESFSQLDLDMANSSFDRETLEALPADIRAEVLANERREREALAAASAPADISRAQEMDNASFVASLAPDLREEILVTCDDAFLQTLSSQVRAEAMVLRERAAFRTTYRERQPDPQRAGGGGARGGGNDGLGDLFQRPTLRRMLTSHGADGLVGGASRRAGRRNVYMDSNGNIRRGSRRDGAHSAESAAYAGMLRVDRDEDEPAAERMCDDRCVKALFRLLFLAQSAIQNRVLQRVLTNLCVYPLTRASVRETALRVITRALARPLVPTGDNDNDDDDDNFPPTRLIGCNDVASRSKSGAGAFDLPPEVLTRMLHVLVSLAKYNARFSVELLRAHGMRRAADGDASDESGASVLVELLAVPFVCRNGTTLETLLELLELVLLPLGRLLSSKKSEDDAAATATPDDAAKQDESEWVVVPGVTLDVAHMSTIVSVLCMDICTPQMQERTVAILKLLNRVAANRGRVIDAVVHHASRLARTSKAAAARVGSAAYESSAVLRSAQDELRLLRLLHTLSDICDSTAAFTEYCRAIGLDPLWDELSRSLEDARAKGGLEEKEGGGGGAAAASSTEATASAEDDNVDGMVIEGKSAGASCAMAALLARFLPMVEAFFVVNARDAASMSLQVPDSTEREEAVVANLRATGFSVADASATAIAAATAVVDTVPSAEAAAAAESMRLANFVEANRVLLNILVREKPSLLDASLAALIKMSRCRAYLDFDNKRSYFQSAMKKLRQTALRHGGSTSSVRIPVRREHIFEDSYYALRMRSGQELRRKLHISFTGEEGIDAGGVTREWYMILAREIFNPNYVLFTSAADSPTFQPNPLSYVNKDHLSYFEFVGKVLGKAVADGQLLDAHFTRSFYKHILQLPISYHDMEAIDPEYYRNLHSILDNAIADLGLELTFSAEQSNFGKLEFNIHKAYGNTNALPSAHTCFNQLDLPEYESEEKLKQRLLLAIREGTEGFGFG